MGLRNITIINAKASFVFVFVCGFKDFYTS